MNPNRRHRVSARRNFPQPLLELMNCAIKSSKQCAEMAETSKRRRVSDHHHFPQLPHELMNCVIKSSGQCTEMAKTSKRRRVSHHRDSPQLPHELMNCVIKSSEQCTEMAKIFVNLQDRLKENMRKNVLLKSEATKIMLHYSEKLKAATEIERKYEQLRLEMEEMRTRHEQEISNLNEENSELGHEIIDLRRHIDRLVREQREDQLILEDLREYSEGDVEEDTEEEEDLPVNMSDGSIVA